MTKNIYFALTQGTVAPQWPLSA